MQNRFRLTQQGGGGTTPGEDLRRLRIARRPRTGERGKSHPVSDKIREDHLERKAILYVRQTYPEHIEC